jgi:hypothetical protein
VTVLALNWTGILSVIAIVVAVVAIIIASVCVIGLVNVRRAAKLSQEVAPQQAKNDAGRDSG